MVAGFFFDYLILRSDLDEVRLGKTGKGGGRIIISTQLDIKPTPRLHHAWIMHVLKEYEAGRKREKAGRIGGTESGGVTCMVCPRWPVRWLVVVARCPHPAISQPAARTTAPTYIPHITAPFCIFTCHMSMKPMTEQKPQAPHYCIHMRLFPTTWPRRASHSSAAVKQTGRDISARR